MYLNPEFPVHIDASNEQWLKMSAPVVEDVLSIFHNQKVSVSLKPAKFTNLIGSP